MIKVCCSVENKMFATCYFLVSIIDVLCYLEFVLVFPQLVDFFKVLIVGSPGPLPRPFLARVFERRGHFFSFRAWFSQLDL